MPAMVEHIERQTKQKDAIRNQLAGCEEFLSAQDLHRSLQDSGIRIGLATVYRQLNSLAESGAVDTIRLDGQQLFRLCGDDAHHHHMVCTGCGRTVEIESPGELASRHRGKARVHHQKPHHRGVRPVLGLPQQDGTR